MDLYRALVAPIRRLPAEVLEIVFISCLDSDDDYTAVRLIITRICFFWRHIARNAPKFWTPLKVRFGISLPHYAVAEASLPEFQTRMKFVESWVALASSSPLTFHLSIGTFSTGPIFVCWRAILSSMLGFSSTLTCLLLYVPVSFFNFFLKLPGNTWGVLETVVLHIRPSPHDQVDPFIQWSDPKHTVFVGANHLRCLELSISTPLPYETLPIPWSQITSLRIKTTLRFGSIGAGAWYTILQKCINLGKCVVEVAHHDMVFAKPLILDHLETFDLKVVSSNPTNLANTLHQMYFPNLMHLRYNANRGIVHTPSFTTRISSTLESLYLDSSLNVDRLHALLQSLPNLRVFHCKFKQHHVCEVLSNSNNPVSFGLEELTLHHHIPLEPRADCVYNIVKFRRTDRRVVKVRSLILTVGVGFPEEEKVELWERISPFVEDGFRYQFAVDGKWFFFCSNRVHSVRPSFRRINIHIPSI